MRHALSISAVDYHTAGEPFRIVTAGVEPLAGRTILDKRRHAAEQVDHIRKLLVNEPRGHADMYGCFVTEPEDDGADLGVVFFHNAGYSTACGHGTIALVTWALDTGRVALAEPTVRVVVDVPSGRLETVARVSDGRVESVRFRNVPSYVERAGLELRTSEGALNVGIAFGGAFYASVDVAALGLSVEAGHLPRLIELGRELKRLIEADHEIVHPLEPELRDIYGVIFFEELNAGPPLHQRNVTVFADGEVDRSPCGSGTSARLALLHAAGRVGVGDELRHESIVGTVFTACVVATSEIAGRPAVVTEVEGSAFATGRHEFVLDPHDPLGSGFLLR
jgi:proline racemase